METTQQLEEKLKEKVDTELTTQIDLNAEQDVFHKLVLKFYYILLQMSALNLQETFYIHVCTKS